MSNNFEKKDRQLDNLINLVENHTRTERHLEQYSHIGSIENKENAREKQRTREKQINTLKNEITDKNTDKISLEQQIENIADNYTRSENYLQNNFDNMQQDAINNLADKQKNRLEQLTNLSELTDKKDEMF